MGTFAAEEFTTTEGSFDVNDSASVEEDDVAPETSFEVDLYDTTGSFEMPMEDDLVEMLPKLSGSFAKHLPEMGLVQEEVNAGKKVCKMAHGMADHNCVVHDLFSSSKVGCKTVAKAPKKKAKKVGCKNKILKYACPKSCKSGKRSMYYKDQSKLLKSKFKMGCKKFVTKARAKAKKAGKKPPCLTQPLLNLMCPNTCAGATTCKVAHGKKDHNCAVHKLFANAKVGCKQVAKKKMCKGTKNKILFYACPKSCKSKVPARAYATNQDVQFKKKFGKSCKTFVKMAIKAGDKTPCIHQPIVNLMCPKSCPTGYKPAAASGKAKIAKEIITDVRKLAGMPAVSKTKPSKSGRTNCFLIGSKRRVKGAKTLKGKGAKKAETTVRMIKMTASSRFPCHKACDSPKALMKTLKFHWIRGAQTKKTHGKKAAGYRICVGQAPKPKRMAQTHCTLLSKYCNKVKELQMINLESGDEAFLGAGRRGGAFLSTTGSFTLSSGGARGTSVGGS